jgi:thiol-disulfide isomerase/thioredoxin
MKWPTRFSILVLAALMLQPVDAKGETFPVPAVEIQTLDGKPFSLSSLRGNVVVLDFWASWCLPCRASFPFLNTLQALDGPRGLRVVGLTLEENNDSVSAFLDSMSPVFSIVRDPSGRAGLAFDVVAIPTTFLLDREGRVAARFEGGDRSLHSAIENAVEKLLSGQPLAPDTGFRVATGLRKHGALKAWQRGYLADPMMSLDGDPVTRLLREHVHSSKEGAAGDGGAAGGGCGCN